MTDDSKIEKYSITKTHYCVEISMTNEKPMFVMKFYQDHLLRHKEYFCFEHDKKISDLAFDKIRPFFNQDEYFKECRKANIDSACFQLLFKYFPAYFKEVKDIYLKKNTSTKFKNLINLEFKK